MVHWRFTPGEDCFLGYVAENKHYICADNLDECTIRTEKKLRPKATAEAYAAAAAAEAQAKAEAQAVLDAVAQERKIQLESDVEVEIPDSNP